LKYCPRIIFYIKNNAPQRILWRIKSNATASVDNIAHYNFSTGKNITEEII
jgi:hypothetical protein